MDQQNLYQLRNKLSQQGQVLDANGIATPSGTELFSSIAAGDFERYPISPNQTHVNLHSGAYNPSSNNSNLNVINGNNNVRGHNNYNYVSSPATWVYPPSNSNQSLQLLNNIPDFNTIISGSSYSSDASVLSSVQSPQSKYRSEGTDDSSVSSSSSSPGYTYSKNGSIDTSASGASPTHTKDGKVKAKRSRMGCLTCRHRKKRCCERKPKCQECTRLGLSCTWPTPGSERRNRPKNARINAGMHYDACYGNIKILRGIVEHRINAN